MNLSINHVVTSILTISHMAPSEKTLEDGKLIWCKSNKNLHQHQKCTWLEKHYLQHCFLILFLWICSCEPLIAGIVFQWKGRLADGRALVNTSIYHIICIHSKTSSNHLHFSSPLWDPYLLPIKFITVWHQKSLYFWSHVRPLWCPDISGGQIRVWHLPRLHEGQLLEAGKSR